MFMQLMYKITAKVHWCRILHLVQEEDTPLAASNQKVKALVVVVYAVWGNSLYTKEKADCYIRFFFCIQSDLPTWILLQVFIQCQLS